jgi:hypothetical protein
MKYAFAGTRCRSTEATPARVHGQIETPRRPTDFDASAKRSKREKLLTPPNSVARVGVD